MDWCNILKRSKGFKSIERDEFLPLALLFIHSFLNGLALIFFETTANTLFLMEYDTSTLPYVYILTALVSVGSGYFYTKLENKVSITKLLRITMLFVIFIIFFFLILIQFNDSKLAYLGIMVSKDLVWMFVGMEFGILTGMIFNIRQGKRLFGLLMSGEILAGIFGGLSIGIILNYIDTASLLLISVITLSMSFILLHHILNKFPERFTEDEEEEDIEESNFSYASLLKNKYYLLFFAVSVLSFFIFYFIDYMFFFYVEEKFTDEKELASFFGIFYAVLNIVNLCSSLFVSGAMLSRYGIIFGLMAIPILALIGTSSLILTAAFSLGAGFVILIIIKLLDEVLDISILSPTFKVLYQSIPVKQRMKVLAFRETIVEPVAMGLAGALLLGVSFFEGMEIVYYFLIAMSIAWLYLGRKLKTHYVSSLEKLLIQREVFSGDLSLDDIDEEVLLRGIESDNDIEVIYCLDSLIKIDYTDIDIVFKTLLSHGSKNVRIGVLEYIDELSRESLINELNKRINTEKDAAVLNTLFRLYAKLGAANLIEVLSQYVDDNDAVIQEGAIVGLLQHGGIDGILVAGKVLNNLFDSNEKSEKIIALNTLSHMKIPSFYDQLKDLLSSNDPDIKLTTIQVIGNLQIKRLVPEMLQDLERDAYRNTIVQSLIKFNKNIFHEVITCFNDISSLNGKHALIKVLSVMKTDESHYFLLEQFKDPLMCDTVLEKMFDANYVSKNEAAIEKMLASEVEKIIFYLNTILKFDKNNLPNSFLVINELLSRKMGNLFLVLGFRYPKEMILQSMLNYKSHSSDKRAYAVEVIDNMLTTDMKRIVLPILEEVSIEKKIANYAKQSFSADNEKDFIDGVLCDEHSPLILRLSLIYELGKNKNKAYLNQIECLVSSLNTDIKQTSIWALGQIQRG